VRGHLGEPNRLQASRGGFLQSALLLLGCHETSVDIKPLDVRPSCNCHAITGAQPRGS
jgi:hypothetical protein